MKIGGVVTNQNATSVVAPATDVLVGLRATNFLSFKIKYPWDSEFSSSFYALVNPETFSESVNVEYSKRPVLGLSHEVIQYIRTASRELDFAVYFNWQIVYQKYIRGRQNEAPDGYDPIAYRNFFQSLTVPAGPMQAPPLVRIVWQGAWLFFEGVVTSIDTAYEQFAPDGTPLIYSMSMRFLEVNRGLITARSVSRSGFGAEVAKEEAG